jgi:hypothetical protein
MFNKKLKKELEILKEGFTIYLEGQKKFLVKDFILRNKIDDRFNSQIESLKGEVKKLKRLRDDDLDLITSLSLQLVNLKKALHLQRESIMLLMEHFKLYFDIEGDERVVKKNKKK